MITDTGLHWDATDLVAAWEEDGGPVLFHHGIGITSEVWLDWVPVLADRHRVVRFDLRGFGRSAGLPPGRPWSLEDLAQDVLAVARAAGLDRFHLVGESLGGTVGLYLAAHHPEHLRSLTIASTSHRGGAIQRVREWRAFIAQHGMVAWSRMMMDGRMDPARVPEPLQRWFETTQAACAPEAILTLADLLIGTDLTADLGRITAPALLLAPERSPFVPLPVMLEIQSLIPRSELRVFPGVRHAIVHSHGRACARALAEFLARRT